MVERVKGNFKGVEVEYQSHVVKCEAYKDLREGKDTRQVSDLVKFFREVQARRELQG